MDWVCGRAGLHALCGSDDPFSYTGSNVFSHHVDSKLLENYDFKHSPNIYCVPTAYHALCLPYFCKSINHPNPLEIL